MDIMNILKEAFPFAISSTMDIMNILKETFLFAITADTADLTIFNSMVELFARGVTGIGTLYCGAGLLGLARGYKDHAGTEMNNGINQIVSGGVYLIAAVIIKTITL
jgi:hypothetical protein